MISIRRNRSRPRLEQVVRDVEKLLAKEPLDANKVFDRILTATRELSGGARGQLLTVYPDYMRVRATTGREKRGTVVPLETSFCGKFVVATGEAHIAHDLCDPEYKGAYIDFLGEEDLPMLSELAVPVFGGREVIAVINVESPDTCAFDISHQRALERLAEATAVTLRLVVREERLERQRTAQEAMHQIDATLAEEPLDADAVFDRILEEAKDLINARRGQLLLVHKDYLTIRATTGRESRGTLVPLDTSFCGRFVVATGEPHIANDLRKPEYNGAYMNFLSEKDLPMRSELAVPVFSGEKMIGILNFESSQISAFDLDHQHTIQRFADATAIALRIAAEASERMHLEKLHAAEERIQDVMAAEPFSPDAVFDCILTEARALIGGERGQVLLVHPDYLTIQATTGQESRGTKVPLEDSFCGRFVVATGKPHIAHDLRDPEYKGAYINFLGEEGLPMLSELAVPARSGGNMIGILNFESPEVNAFDESDVETIGALANDTAIALRRAADRQFEDEIKEIVQELAEANVPLDEWLRRVVSRALDLSKAVNGQFLEVEGDRLTIRASAGDRPPQDLNLRFDNCITGYAAATRGSVCVTDVTKPPWEKLYQGFPGRVRSEVAVPLKYANHVIGVLNMESNRVGAFTERHVQMLSLLAQPVALALHLRQVEENQVHVLHALRGRLNLIKHGSQSILNKIEAGTVPSAKQVRRMRGAAEVLLDVVARTTTRPNLRPVALTTSLETLRSQYPLRDLRVNLAFTEAAENIPLVAADPDRLQEILNLVVDNAVDALQEARRDEPSLTFDIDPAPGEDHVRLLITDNGSGIPDRVLRDLFKGITTKQRLMGSGVGLPYCRHMMHKMLGEIRVEWTKLSKGTCISLGLREVAGTIVHTRGPAGLDPDEQSCIRLFSGNSQFVDLARWSLERMSFEVITNEDYQLSAEEMLAIDRQPTLLIIDLTSQAGLGLRLFEKLAIHQAKKNSGISDEAQKDHYDVYLFWALPESETDVLNLVKDTLEEAPKGKLL